VLVIQDPTNEQGTYLLESILDALPPAQKVAGGFAFASSAGIRLLTNDDLFQMIASRFPVELVIGIDAVTNSRALDELERVCRAFPSMTVRAFYNPRPESLFHPKFVFMRTAAGGTLITGSGNLTEGGLLGNWEAYSVEELNEAEINSVEDAWDAWKAKHEHAILPLDNPLVRERAAGNHVLAREGDLPTLVTPQVPLEDDPDTTQLLPNNADVLIAEIPRSKNRWKQANFDKYNFETFFGANKNRMVVFRHVNGDGSMAEYERNRPPVTVKSRNFRFELNAASRLDYPENGRPIGVFIRVATRTFFYRLLLPDDPQYLTVLEILGQRGGEGDVRRVRMTVEELRREWPTAPFWQLPSNI
jgi:HKD family nuclease